MLSFQRSLDRDSVCQKCIFFKKKRAKFKKPNNSLNIQLAKNVILTFVFYVPLSSGVLRIWPPLSSLHDFPDFLETTAFSRKLLINSRFSAFQNNFGKN